MSTDNFVIPAIDIQNGKCVRLTKGELDKKTVYYEDPLDALHYWEDQGASRIHIVDLDGAFGIGTNYKLIQRLIKKTDIKIQMGGGIRSKEKALKLAELGVERLVIGTTAVKNPDFITKLNTEIDSSHIIVALDQKNGKPAIKGWTETLDTDIWELGKIMESKGAGYVLISSVEGDGAFTGPDIESTKKMVDSVGIPVIAAGGVRDKEDILALKSINAHGVIVGKAFYERRLDYADVRDL